MCCCCIDCCCSGIFKLFGLLAWCLSCGRTSLSEGYSRFGGENDTDLEQNSTRSAMNSKCNDCMGWTITISIAILILAVFGMQIATLVIVTDTVSVSDIEDYMLHSHTRDVRSLDADVGEKKPRTLSMRPLALSDKTSSKDEHQSNIESIRECATSLAKWHDTLYFGDIEEKEDEIPDALREELFSLCNQLANLRTRSLYDSLINQ